jgi:hypothetical protein
VKRVLFDSKTTRVFEGAQVRGRTSKTVIDDNNVITVRMPAVDAPELHYLRVESEG